MLAPASQLSHRGKPHVCLSNAVAAAPTNLQRRTGLSCAAEGGTCSSKQDTNRLGGRALLPRSNCMQHFSYVIFQLILQATAVTHGKVNNHCKSLQLQRVIKFHTQEDVIGNPKPHVLMLIKAPPCIARSCQKAVV